MSNLLSQEDMVNLLYSPANAQQVVLEKFEQLNNGQNFISDPTNAFNMLLEAAIMSSSSSAYETKGLIRKLFPSLAVTANDLSHHLSDEELVNIYATPSVAHITFLISIMELNNNGYRPEGAKYKETTLPKYLEVTILEHTFTLLNDIVVKLYDEGNIFVEQISNGDDISFDDIGVIPTYIKNDKEGTSWIVFEVPMKQIKRTRYNATIILGDRFKLDTRLSDSYFYSNAYYKNRDTGNELKYLYKSHNEEFLNPLVPTICINVADKNVTYTIPDMYILNNGINGEVTIDIFETKGNIMLPIKDYTVQDFKITKPDVTTTDLSKLSFNNIVVAANSRYDVEGGRDTISTDELRDIIINNNTGNINSPITANNIKRNLDFNGFELFKANDIITERLYVASKNLPELDSSLLSARQDIYFNSVKIVLDELKNNNFININKDRFIIKSNSIFKEENGIVTLISNEEKSMLDSLSSIDKINFYRNKNYFTNPYYYVIDKEENINKCRIYNLDNPFINNLKIIGKNNNITQNVNIDKYTVLKISTGYRLVFTVTGNDEFNKLNSSLFTGQLSIPLNGGSNNIVFDGKFDNTNSDVTKRYLTFDIESNLFVNSENFIEIENGYANISNKFINLLSSAKLYLLTYDTAIVDEVKFLHSEIVKPKSQRFTVLTSQVIDINFGTELEYLYNRMYTTYTDRKYKRHNLDIPLVYNEDVYETDINTGNIFTCENGEIKYNIKHKKGDVVLDELGNKIYKHKKGDVVLDENNLPIVDLDSGVIRYVDILMLEYIFSLSQSNAYINYNKICLDILDTWLNIDLKEINNKLVDNTKVLYKSYKTSKNVSISINKVRHVIPYIVKPSVIIYTTRESYSVDELNHMKNIIGKVIHKHLDKNTVIVNDIKLDLASLLPEDIIGYSINGLDNLGNLEVLNIYDKTTRLSINKLLDLNKSNELIVTYDVDIKIQSKL